MTELIFRWMNPNEVSKIRDIDRSERIRTGYNFSDGKLHQRDVVWDSPSWALEGDSEHSAEAKIRFCQGHLSNRQEVFGQNS